MVDTAIALHTRDLRVHDNPVLSAAAKAEHVVPLFVRDKTMAATGFVSKPRRQLLDECLADLDASLRERGAGLVVREGEFVEQVCRLARTVEAAEVHMAADHSAFAVDRIRRLGEALREQGRTLVCHDAVHSVIAPKAVTPQGSDHFSVFTPYHRRWVDAPRRRLLPAPTALRLPDGLDPPVVGEPGGGETAGRALAKKWFADGVDDYEERHDDLAGDATSKLSPYLHFGAVSALASVTAAVQRRSAGGEAFARQLAWRDFHLQVLAARPGAAHEDYRPRGDGWRHDRDALQAWQTGHTGIPIVDAGMRQLLAEGWMHNRARLITASFLVKTLYLDWRDGAAFFLEHLLDGDIANNNLNWQWVAGTGTDTRPNRVLNPLRQAQRYDPTGDYVRRWVPELAELDDPREVHEPWRRGELGLRRLRYPAPIVDLDEARQQFLQARKA